MPYYEFDKNDLFYNTIEAHPKFEFLVYDGKTYYNRRPEVAGQFTGSTPNAPVGHINLYELNVDRVSASTGLIYPFVTKAGSLTSFKTTSTSNFNNDFAYGDKMTGSYPLTASLHRHYYSEGGTASTRLSCSALLNTLNYYKYLSPHYAYSSSTAVGDGWDKVSQEMSVISIPSIFYGSYIKKGTLDLKFYITGTLVGHLNDIHKNGELIQVGPTGSQGSGSVAGVVLYNEGFLFLTGSWDLTSPSLDIDYLNDTTNLQKSKWIFWGVGMGGYETAAGTSIGSSDAGGSNSTRASASFEMSYKGTTNIQTVTMLAHARRAQLNYSNNPTYVQYGQPRSPVTNSMQYIEPTNLKIKNTVTSIYAEPSASFEKHTYITKIGVYDEDRNLIAIANLATPVKKTEDRELTFKLKLDI